MQIISLVIITTLPFPILWVQCIYCHAQYVVRKTGGRGLSRPAKCVLGTFAFCLLLSLVALPVLMVLVLREVVNGLIISKEGRLDAVWMPKLMSMYCLSAFGGLSTHIGLPAAAANHISLYKIVWPIATLTAIATVILSVLGSVLVVDMTTRDLGYALLSCGNSLPYFHSCGMLWYLMPKAQKRIHWKPLCIWALNFLAVISVLVLMCLIPLHQTEWFLPGQLITILASQIPSVLWPSIRVIIDTKPGNPKPWRLGSSAGSSKQDVLNIRKEEQPVTVLEMLTPKHHDTQSCQHDMQSLDDQEIGQAV